MQYKCKSLLFVPEILSNSIGEPMHTNFIMNLREPAQALKNLVGVGLITLLMMGCSPNSDEEKAEAEKTTAAQSEQSMLVYSARKEHLIKPLFDAFQKDTGIQVNFVTDEAQPLLARLEAESERSPADLFMAVDAGNLWQATQKNILRPTDSKLLTDRIPAAYRDPQNQWFGLSLRARTIVYSTERVKPEDLSTYEALADAKWKKKLCLRTSQKVYNQSLVAMLIQRWGAEKTETIIKGWVDNLATEVFSDDTALIKAIAAGQCDVGIVNTYYYGALANEQKDLPVAVFWANQKAGGVHVNLSGAGITKHAPHPELAQQLLEWLVSDKAQAMFAEINFEYPAVADVKPHKAVAAWGEFEADPENLSNAGRLQAEAIKLMDRAGYR